MDQERVNLSNRSRSRSNTPLSAAIRNTLKKERLGVKSGFRSTNSWCMTKGQSIKKERIWAIALAPGPTLPYQLPWEIHGNMEKRAIGSEERFQEYEHKLLIHAATAAVRIILDLCRTSQSGKRGLGSFYVGLYEWIRTCRVTCVVYRTYIKLSLTYVKLWFCFAK